MFNIIKKIIENLFKTHQWCILIKKSNESVWVRLKQPKDVSRADPFIVYKEGKYYIFFEEFDIKKRHGYLCVGEYYQNCNEMKNIRVILNEKYHLSFPNVFLYKNEYYMIPESSENKTIDLYKFINFPYNLVKVKTLISDISAADNVILFKNKKVYLFTSLYTHSRCLHSENLSIYQSNDLLNDDFIEIHNNPVLTDKEFVRNGGQFIESESSLFRVSQDCKKRYGYKINFMKVNEITDTEYKEEVSKMIYPPKGYIAFHTYNIANDMEIADGKIVVKNLFVLINNFVDLLKLIIKRLG